MTERWATEHLYCPRCDARHLDALPDNTKVADFACASCDLQIQLKAKRGRMGRSFVNSAYAPKVAAIRARRLPDYALLAYDPLRWSVTDVTFLPGHFITESAVEKRPPLPPTARRAGWVGSKVHLDALPPDAFVPAVASGQVRPKEVVRAEYERFEFLRLARAEGAGWLADVLRHVRQVAPRSGDRFHLQALYARSEAALAERHPANRNIRAKIRQQLQILRDRGIVAFHGAGQYTVVR